MIAGPLKNRKHTNCKVIFGSGGKTEAKHTIYFEFDIASAVEWLKDELKKEFPNTHEIWSYKKRDYPSVFHLIDEAFPDLKKK